MTGERSKPCPVCNTPANFSPTTGDAHDVQCPTCGRYTITGSARATMNNVENRHILSGVLRDSWENGITTEVVSENIQELMEKAPVLNSTKKIDRILAYIQKKSEAEGDSIDLNMENDYPIAFAKDAQRFEYLLKQAIKKEYVEPHPEIHKRTYKCRLTIDGENRLSAIEAPTAQNKDKQESLQSSPSLEVFVNPSRIDELKAIAPSKFDLTRLIKLCEELNVCYGNECYIAVAALTRTIMNHVPPIFGQPNFSGVANHYGGDKSFKKSMQNLEKSAKNISDRHLHEPIDKKVTLPNQTQVNFSQDFDVLLEKVVKELK